MFEASPVIEGLSWRLDGVGLANADSRGRVDWEPTPGKHALALVSADGKLLSTIAFEVRGNPLR